VRLVLISVALLLAPAAARAQCAHDDAPARENTARIGAGLVKITMNGRHDVKRVEIDAELMKDDKEMIEDLVAAAVNDANRRVEKMTQDRMSDLTSGMGLPPGMKLPF